MMEGFIIGVFIGFFLGGAFMVKAFKDDVAAGKAIYVGDDEYRAEKVPNER